MKFQLIVFVAIIVVVKGTFFHPFLKPLKPKHFDEDGLTVDQVRQLIEKNGKVRSLYCNVTSIADSKLLQLKNAKCCPQIGQRPPAFEECEEEYFKGSTLDEIRKRLCTAGKSNLKRIKRTLQSCYQKKLKMGTTTHHSTTTEFSIDDLSGKELFTHLMNEMTCYEKILS